MSSKAELADAKRRIREAVATLRSLGYTVSYRFDHAPEWREHHYVIRRKGVAVAAPRVVRPETTTTLGAYRKAADRLDSAIRTLPGREV